MASETSSTTNASTKLVNRPTFLENKNSRFLIMDAPTDANLPAYMEVMSKKNVKVLVRACEGTYSTLPLTKAGIKVVELSFPDGDPPPDDVVSKWLDLIKEEFARGDDTTVGVHCVAGLGRAPVLVAIAMIEMGMDPMEAISFIRKRRRGAINARQLNYLEGYKRHSDAHVGGCGCVIC